jgi:hypothetical protein
MIVDSPAAFRAALAKLAPPAGAVVTARGVLLVTPVGFRLAEESEADNRYMARGAATSEARALAEHSRLAAELGKSLPVVVFPGRAETPDAVFPNNVFATSPGRVVIGRMRHAVRRREAERADIRHWLESARGYETIDLSGREDLVAELTGPLVVDHARGIGYCGLSGRCDRAGAAAMHEAFGLGLTFIFELAPGEYHANVVLSVLAGRAVVLHPGSFADPEVPLAIAAAYPERALLLSDAEKLGFAGNCIALAGGNLWMSDRAAASLRPESRKSLAAWGFSLRSVPLDEIEKAGGSLRCCVAELF